jgi:fructoselysine-6-P-deglycase FrlB-like protein
MADEFIRQATELMREQTGAYQKLSLACAQLLSALTEGTPEIITALVRSGEAELLLMRSRVVRLMGTLTAFADARARDEGAGRQLGNISPEVREAFAFASSELMESAREFQRVHRRTATLANNGAIFAATAIELCGIPPITYRAPYTRRREG